ncbi:MAG: hypothetical protein ACREFK_02445 [Stellaceae bacterium]
MATAGASVLAGRCGLQKLVVPLLVLAVLQALWAPAAGALRHRAEFRVRWSAWLTIGSANEHSGIHTVPLGLAVIAGGLAGLSADGVASWPLLLMASTCLALTWLLAIVCVGRFLWSLASRGLALETIDGAWFLVPAALLGAAIATEDVAALVASRGVSVLALLALGGALLGWSGYWAVAVVAFVRVRRFGFGGVPQAPWWIAMGCAGLAAAALGRVLDGLPPWPALRTFLITTTTATDICAIALLVPVVAGGVRFLLWHCRFRAAAPWPPTFSTAVFALGCLQTGQVLQSPAFRLLGLGAGFATLAFWAVTASWNVKGLMRRQIRGA